MIIILIVNFYFTYKHDYYYFYFCHYFVRNFTICIFLNDIYCYIFLISTAEREVHTGGIKTKRSHVVTNIKELFDRAPKTALSHFRSWGFFESLFPKRLPSVLWTLFSVRCSQNDPKKLTQTERKEKLSSLRGEPAPGLQVEEPPDGADWAGGFVRETAGKQIVRLSLKVRDGSVRTLALI